MTTSMKAMLIFTALVTMLIGVSFANHETIPVLQGKVAIAEAECSFNKSGQMIRDGEVKKSCYVLMESGNSTTLWFAIWDGTKVTEVFEGDTQTLTVRSVWKYGQRAL